LNAVLPTIHSLGAELVVISPQLPVYLADLKTKLKLNFDILHDAGNAVAEAFGIAMRLPDELIEVYQKLGLDLVKFNGDEFWRLPVPARFVIDRGGIVRAVEADPDYTRRPEPEVTLEALRALGP
jgi:peroxiredoxin